MRRLLGLSLLATLTACTAADQDLAANQAGFVAPEPASPSRADYELAFAPGADLAAKDALISKLPRIRLNDDGVMRYRYVWEGDLLLTREQILALMSAPAQESENNDTPELKVMTDSRGRPVFWPRGSRNLTYWVNESSFPSSHLNAAVTAVTAAAANWENACAQCGVTIRRVPDSGSATFRVEFQSEDVPYIAAAFFPNDPPYRRVLFIGRDFFTSSFDQAGVMRHELGHVLGYRHEHIEGIAGCYREGNDWRPLTAYDPDSVMHYYCGGGGSFAMPLSQADLRGHQSLYGG